MFDCRVIDEMNTADKILSNIKRQQDQIMVHSKKYIPQIVLLILLLMPMVISAQKNIHAELHISLTSDYQVYDRMIFGQFKQTS